MTVVAPRRHRAAWDIVVSAILLVLSYVAYWIGALFALLSVSLLGACSDDCPFNRAGESEFISALLVFLVGVIGTAATVLLLVFRRRAWWAAAATLVLTIAGWLIGAAVFGLFS